MTNKYVGAAKFIKNLITGNKISKTIDSVKPGTKFEGIPKYQKDIIKARSDVQKSFKPINEGIAKQTKELRQTLQKVRGEKVTASGISKGKDVGPGIYEPKKKIEKKAKGGRVGLKFGGGADMGKKKSNIQKIKEAFGTKSKNKNLKPVDKKKNPGLAKLPIEVRNKMGYAKKGGRA